MQILQDIAQLFRYGNNLCHGEIPLPGIGAQGFPFYIFTDDTEHGFIPVLLIKMRQSGVLQFPQHAEIRLKRKESQIAAGCNGQISAVFFLYQKCLPARVAGQTFHLVPGLQKIGRETALREDRLYIRDDMLEFVHFSLPPKRGSSRSWRIICVSTKDT